MKTSDRFNTRIGELVDAYQGAVPLARCILEATRLQYDIPGRLRIPDLLLEPDDFGQLFLRITFADSSSVVLSVEEEMA